MQITSTPLHPAQPSEPEMPPSYGGHVRSTVETSRSEPLRIDTSPLPSPLLSPTSPDYDDLTALPSPLVGDDRAFVSSRPSIDLLSISTSPRVPQTIHNSPEKKTYGSLTMRPSASTGQSTRVISDFQTSSPMVTSPSTRNFSSPYQTGFTHPSHEADFIKREKQQDLLGLPPHIQLTYEGFDSTNTPHHWKYVRCIGKGSFSTVILAELSDDEQNPLLQQVAIKVVELPQDYVTKGRVEGSLKRELKILQTVKHPSIIQLLALHTQPDAFHIVLPYHKGGDLFQLTNNHRDKMSSLLIRKIFAEIVVGIAYLHANDIVHRDIKLENILMNYTIEELLRFEDIKNIKAVTITDFGLSREIDPAHPLLTTRCGSEDYVAPELLIGLPYDGRQTDSWAMGVLLYSIMEGRLPFDPPPIAPGTIRSRRVTRVSHRIAKYDWRWYRFKNEEAGAGWDENEWKAAKFVVGNLLVKRENRMTSQEVCMLSYVHGMVGEDYPKFLNK